MAPPMNTNSDTGSDGTSCYLGNDEHPPGILGAIPLLQIMVLAGLLRFPLADFCQGVLLHLAWLHTSLKLLSDFC